MSSQKIKEAFEKYKEWENKAEYDLLGKEAIKYGLEISTIIKDLQESPAKNTLKLICNQMLAWGFYKKSIYSSDEESWYYIQLARHYGSKIFSPYIKRRILKRYEKLASKIDYRRIEDVKLKGKNKKIWKSLKKKLKQAEKYRNLGEYEKMADILYEVKINVLLEFAINDRKELVKKYENYARETGDFLIKKIMEGMRARKALSKILL